MNSLVVTTTPSLEKTKDFYTRLKFIDLSQNGRTLFSDGKVIIEVVKEKSLRAGIKMYKADWSETIERLNQFTRVIGIDGGHALTDPTGTWIYLMRSGDEIIPLKKDTAASVLGNYVGVSLEAMNSENALKVYDCLGFQKTMGDLSQGWLVLANKEGFAVSIMAPFSCPHLFYNPSLTYFNGKENNPIIIDKVRQAQIEITEEITRFNDKGEVDNIIIRDPGGLGFFVFND